MMMQETMIDLCWLPSNFTHSEMTHMDLFLMLGYSKRTVKKFLNHAAASRVIKDRNWHQTYRYPVNLINYGKISSASEVECQEHHHLRILHENDDFAVIFKPHRLHTVPGDYSQTDHVLSHLRAQGHHHLLNLYPEFLDGGFIQRLDYETSGLLILAKHRDCYEDLRYHYKDRFFKKIYHCWVLGSIRTCGIGKSGELLHLLTPIGPKGYLIKAREVVGEVLEHQSIAKLQWYWLEEKLDTNGKIWTKLEIVLETGLRHQIRVQLAQWGFPIIGDPLYNNDDQMRDGKGRLLLQHQKIEFYYGQQLCQFTVPADCDLSA